MSGTSSRWGSFSVSVARTGEGVFLESSSGRSSGSGLAGREQGWGVLEIEGDFAFCQGSSRDWKLRDYLTMSSGGVPGSHRVPPDSRAAGLNEKAPVACGTARAGSALLGRRHSLLQDGLHPLPCIKAHTPSLPL